MFRDEKAPEVRPGDEAQTGCATNHESFIPAARFRLLTPAYDLLCRALGLGETLRRFEMGIIDGLPRRRVLEVGCGTGELLVAIASRTLGSSLTGIDADRDALRFARRKLDDRRLEARLVPGRAEALPFEDGSFDLVVSSLMLHHLDTKTKVQALREWRRVLAQGGALLLVDFDVPRTRWLRVVLWPLRFDIFEERADNFRGRTAGMLAEARPLDAAELASCICRRPSGAPSRG